jgi:hypothetical protein
MLLRHVTRKSFVLLRADEQVHEARRLLGRMALTHVIVRGREPAAYYLFTRQEASDRLRESPEETSISDALSLGEARPIEARAAYTSISKAPERCVVLESGSLVGFFDRATLRTSTRGRESRVWLKLTGEEFHAAEADAGGFSDALGSSPSLTLIADFPETIKVGETVSLLLSLSAADAGARVAASSPPPGSRIDFIVKPRLGFDLEDSGEASLFVPQQGKTSPLLQFRLKATGVGLGHLSIVALHGGQSLNVFDLQPTIEVAPSPEEAERLSLEESLGAVSLNPPDLSLLILETKAGSETLLDLRLMSPNPELGLNLARFGPVRLRSDPFSYFRDFFVDIENFSPGQIGQQRLSNKGSHLFQTLFPEDLQRKLWSLRDRIRTVQVQSEEPWIPWELCKLCGEEGGLTIEGAFFCEQFALTRWLPGTPLRPTLRLDDMAVVVPEDSGLSYALTERESIEAISRGKWRAHRIPATYTDVYHALASGKYGGWHFTGHGNIAENDPNRAYINLQGGQKLTPEDVSGVVSNLGIARPLVFLNACRVGRGGLSLTGAGGWARQFLRAGAGAFVSAYWAVYDASACKFAESLYRELASGQPLGEAARNARARIRASGEPTWLAYTIYAHPLAKVQFSS